MGFEYGRGNPSPTGNNGFLCITGTTLEFKTNLHREDKKVSRERRRNSKPTYTVKIKKTYTVKIKKYHGNDVGI